MRNIIFIFISLLLLSSACTKVIEIDLDEADSRIIVEAPLFEGTNDFVVRLTKSGNYFDNANLTTIDDATVILTEQNGTTLVLDFQGEGNYALPSYTAIAGNSYVLNIMAEGEEISATTYLPELVAIDSLRPEFEPESAFGDEGYVLYTVFQDPEIEENYYRLRYAINGVFDSSPESIFLFDDAFTDGNVIDIPNFVERYQSNETITVELLQMDAAVFDYFSTLSDIVSGNGSAAPANPNSNLTGNALGYFGAFNRNSSTIVIPE